MPTSSVHPYYLIPLDVAGYILGITLIIVHLVALVKRVQFQEFLKKSHRNDFLAQVTLFIALAWFFLLVAPAGMGVISALRVDLAEFEFIRFILQLACPAALILMIVYVKELLFPRALGVLGLMVVAPFLYAAFLKEPASRVLIPIWAYVVIFSSIIFLAKPFLYRNLVAWFISKNIRWTVAAVLGLVYGVIVFACAVLFWQGY